jgi:NAD(P)-dependent dehydrogenase (short-subunit alcohol dehydrogenase family)
MSGNASRVWLITGASSGFGWALAERVLARGERVALVARRAEAMAELAARYPEQALVLSLDLLQEEACREAARRTEERFGRVDVLANIAGRGSLGAAEEFSPQQLREQMEVNFFAAVELSRAVLPIMRRQKSGHLLQLTSIGGIAAFQGFSLYCASKFALEGWSEALRSEVEGLGIRVTIVEPGAFRTEFAGSKNMRPERTIEEYRPVIAPIESYLYGSDGQQPGDPAKAADAMIAVVESEAPPLRLLLGQDAIGLWEKKREQVGEDLQQWRAMGESTAFDGVVTAPVGG